MSSNWWCDFVAGWLGGSAGIVVGHPADTVKVVQQAGGGRGILATIHNLWRTEGVRRGFFKGMLYPIVSNGAINSIFFGVYGSLLPKLQRGDKEGVDYLSVFLAGTVGGAVQLGVACPVELVKVRLQTQTTGSVYRGPWHCLTSVVRSEGLRGAFRGVGPHFFRDGPGFGIYMVLYEGFLELGSGGRANASQTAQFVFGGLAGTLCWLSVLPFDVVKSRMQATDGRHYTGMVQCARDSYRQEGAKVFMRGALAMSLRAFPVNGVTFLVYEVLLDLCQNR